LPVAGISPRTRARSTAQISIAHQSGLSDATGRYRERTCVAASEVGGRVVDVLAEIPLVGWGPIITIAALAVVCLILAILLWRNHKVWRVVFVLLFLVLGAAAVGD